MTRLEASGVTVRYNGRVAVDGVEMTVAVGEWVALIGPNGAGKTSLLRAMAGIVEYSGTIAIDGVDATSLPRRRAARMVALVPQQPTLPDGMTVLDYVLLGRTPHLGYLAVETDADIDVSRDALARLDAADLEARRLGELSGGERQRVVLARALAQESSVLLLDEPTAALDVGHGQQVLDLVDELRRERGISVVAAVHDLTLAAQYADRLALMDGGHIVAEGSPQAVLTEESIRRFSGARVSIVTGPGGEVVVVPRR
ncbi:MAG TPA: ABC transporter ATP-binding protein [Acidimicrobiia bacterium]|nr:ABC transporter ATP-binding protein [Acidimicrobiia bacterium]